MKTIILWIKYLINLVALKISPPKSKSIDVSKLGVNAFYNDVRYGSIPSQALEIHNSLNIKFQRVLFVWNDDTHKNQDAEINFAHIRKVVDSQPEGAKLLVVVYGVPDWAVTNGANAFVEMFRQLCLEFKDNPTVEGYQIWNEPEMESVDFNHKMQVVDSPVNYFNLLGECYKISKMVDPDKIVTNAATRSINQNFPKPLEYNKRLVSLGIENIVDVYSIHWYGEQFEKLYQPPGILDFLNKLNKPIWMTESGESGLSQLKYCSTTWPYLFKKIKKLERVYHYIYHEASDANIQFGMKAFVNGELDVSDLFVYLLNKERL